ncbi:MAG: oligosaccharide flippase family protein [Chloroflexi bacterium]|nr:oligosaccharide flippase family protein [Chloroflexota bacterium]
MARMGSAFLALSPAVRLRRGLLLGLALLILPVLLFPPQVLGGKSLVPFDNLFVLPPWQNFARTINNPQLGIGATPHNDLLGDLVLQNYPWKLFTRESFRARQVPLWNPYLFGGVPFLAAGQNSVLYPLSLLYDILPLIYAYGLFTVIQLWLTGIFTYCLARSLGLRLLPALVVAWTYQASGLMVANALYPMILAALGWLPALLWAIHGYLTTHRATPPAWLPRDRRLLWLAFGVVAVAMEFLAGHIEITYYALLVAGMYSVYRLLAEVIPATGRGAGTGPAAPGSRIVAMVRPAFHLLVMVGLGVALAGVQVVPLLELVRVNFRQDTASLAEVRSWAYPVRQIVTFFIPNFYGNPSYHTIFDIFTGQWIPLAQNALGQSRDTVFWGLKNYVEAASYVGVLPLLLAAIAVIRVRQDRRTWPFVGLVVICLLLAFGTPLYAVLYYGLPGLSQVHTPFRWVYPYTLAVALLAGIGLDGCLSLVECLGQDKIFSSRAVRFLPYLAMLAGAVLVVLLPLTRLWPAPFLRLAGVVFHRTEQAQQSFPDPSLFLSYEILQVSLFGGLLLLSGVVLWLVLRRWRWWPALLAAVLGADLLITGWGFNPAVNPQLAEIVPPSVTFLQDQQQQQTAPFRVTTYGDDKLLNPNVLMLHGIQDIRGYDSIIPKRYVDLVSALDEQRWLLYNRIGPLTHPEALKSPLLDALNVRYIATQQTIDAPDYALVHESDGVRIYERTKRLGPVFLVPATRVEIIPGPAAQLDRLKQTPLDQVVVLDEAPQPVSPNLRTAAPGNNSVTLDAFAAGRYQVTASLAHPGWVIFTDSYFPGWVASVRNAVPDGVREAQGKEVEVPLYRVDYNLKGVQLPAGTFALTIRYSPMSFKIGLYLSFLALVTLLCALIYWLWSRFYLYEREGDHVRVVARNSLVPMATSLGNKVVDFAFAALMLRVLGPELSGRYYFAIVIMGFLEIFTNFGLNLLFTRDVAREPHRAREYLNNTLALRLALWVIALPLLGAFLWVRQVTSPLTADTVWAILLLVVGLVPANVSAALSSLFYARERMEIPAAVTVASTLLKVSLGALVLMIGWGFVGLAAASVLINLVNVVIFWQLVAREEAPLTAKTAGHPLSFSLLINPFLANRTFIWGLVAASLPLMLNHLLQTLFFKIDVTLLQPLKGDEVVGWYSSAYKWIDALLIIPSYVTMAIFPMMSRYAAGQQEALKRAYVLALRGLLLLALPIAVGTTFIAPVLINLLGGAEFLPHGAIALQIMIWFLPLSFVNGVTQYVLIAIDQQRRITWSFAIATAFNIVANLLFIPAFSYPAAAVVTILSEVVLFIPFYAAIRRQMGDLPWHTFVPRLLLAAALLALALWLVHDRPAWVLVLLGAVIYPVALLALGAVTPDDRRLLGRLLPQRLANRFPGILVAPK